MRDSAVVGQEFAIVEKFIFRTKDSLNNQRSLGNYLLFYILCEEPNEQLPKQNCFIYEPC